MDPSSNRPGPIDDGLRDPISTAPKYLYHIVVIFLKGRASLHIKTMMKIY